MMVVGALDHVAVRVEDPAALHQFLQEVLGLERKGTALRGVYALPGGVSLAVFPVGAESGGQGDRQSTRLPDHVALRVDSLRAAEEKLAAHGYHLTGDMVVAPGGLCVQFVES
jgi:catechol 2,3-dioxygenase-like lactoylglutathione lyase family enzyme